jgi:putative transposase
MVENLALRQQLAVFKQRHCRPRLRPADRVFWVFLRQAWRNWANALIVVEPDTVVGWQRKGFRPFWRLISRAKRVGRPRIPRELRALIGRMAQENGWGAPRIHGELLKLGLVVDERTVSRYLPRGRTSPDKLQRWLVFLRNHRDSLVGMDFFTVPAVTFRLLWVFVVLHHERRRNLHFAATEHPDASWITQQLREAFPLDTAPRYAILDRDGKYGHEVPAALQSMGVKPVRTVPRSPWQNPYVEQFGEPYAESCWTESSFLTERSFIEWCVISLPIITRIVVIEPWGRMHQSPGYSHHSLGRVLGWWGFREWEGCSTATSGWEQREGMPIGQHRGAVHDEGLEGGR